MKTSEKRSSKPKKQPVKKLKKTVEKKKVAPKKKTRKSTKKEQPFEEFDSVVSALIETIRRSESRVRTGTPKIGSYVPITIMFFLDKKGNISFEPHPMHIRAGDEAMISSYVKSMASLMLMNEHSDGVQFFMAAFVSMSKIDLLHADGSSEERIGFGMQFKTNTGHSGFKFFEVLPVISERNSYYLKLNHVKEMDIGWVPELGKSSKDDSGPFVADEFILDAIWNHYSYLRLFGDPKNWGLSGVDN